MVYGKTGTGKTDVIKQLIFEDLKGKKHPFITTVSVLSATCTEKDV